MTYKFGRTEFNKEGVKEMGFKAFIEAYPGKIAGIAAEEVFYKIVGHESTKEISESNNKAKRRKRAAKDSEREGDS